MLARKGKKGDCPQGGGGREIGRSSTPPNRRTRSPDKEELKTEKKNLLSRVEKEDLKKGKGPGSTFPEKRKRDYLEEGKHRKLRQGGEKRGAILFLEGASRKKKKKREKGTRWGALLAKEKEGKEKGPSGRGRTVLLRASQGGGGGGTSIPRKLLF